MVVLPCGHQQIVDEIHETHPVVSRMKSLARSFVWGPSMNQDVENKVKSCTQCQTNQKCHHQPSCTHGSGQYALGMSYTWTLLAPL